MSTAEMISSTAPLGEPFLSSASAEAHDTLRSGVLNVALKLGKGVSKAGAPYTWMVDTRELLLQQPYLKLCGALLWERLRPYRPEAVGGMTLAANPLTAAVLYEAWAEGYPLNGFLIRKERKKDGLRKLVEGPELRPGQRVVLVDDMVNSGATQRGAVRALEPFGVELLAVGTILNAERFGEQWLRGRSIAIEALFTLAELGITHRPASRPNMAKVAWRWGPLNRGSHTAPHSRPAVRGDRIFVGSDQGFLVCLSRSGSELWRFTARESVNGIHSSPCARDGRVWVGSYDGFVYCLDAASGALTWERRIGQWVGSSPVLDEAGQRLFIGSEYGEAGGGVVAVAAATGELLWETELSHFVHSTSCWDARREHVLVGCNDGCLYSLRASDGAILWRLHTEGEVKSGPAVDEDGRCFCCSSDGFVYAVDAGSGELLWKRRLGRSAHFRPLVAGQTVLAAGSSGRLLCMETATGNVVWIADLCGYVMGGAALTHDGHIVAGAHDGTISVLNASTGEKLWTTRTGAAVAVEPAVADGIALVPSRDGFLYCLNLEREREV